MIEYGNRTKGLPVPPSVVWDDLVQPKTEGSRVWLVVLPDEVKPRILESESPSRVVWSSLWPSRPDDRIVLELAADGAGTAFSFTMLAKDNPPDESKAGDIRKRLSRLFFADLRLSYGN